MLSLDGVGRTVAGRHLFRDVRWTIHAGERIGLVGPNGSGKTTLLRIIAGRDEPDEGFVRRRQGLRVAYLPQEVEAELPGDASIVEAALAAADDVRALGRECERLGEEIARLATEGGDPERAARLADEYGTKRSLFEWAGGDALEARARQVLGGLGFARDEMDRAVRTFSGGWRMRAMMARLLLSGADLLLLDEPTNHLDLDALGWLEAHLTGSPAALIVVSHDRVFLDTVAGKIADLVRENVRVTKGGWSEWLRTREAERERGEREGKRLAREEEKLERFVERFGFKATKAAAAKDKARLLDDVREERAQIIADAQVRWRFAWPDPPHAPDVLLKLEGVRKGYDGPPVLDNVNIQVRRGERFAVMGPNGAGKTTLLRLITGELRPDAGRREIASGLLVGHFAQHQLEALDPSETVMQAASRGAHGRLPEQVRKALGTFGIGDLHVERPVASLSGGERARVTLARLVLRPASLLLLDEPTNHLDLPFREALEEALAGWPGTLLVVSHDRAFLARVATKTIAVQDGTAVVLDGGWETWRAWRAAQIEAARAAAAPDGGAPHERSREGRRQRAEALQDRNRRLRPLRDELARVEGEIHAKEARIGAIDAQLADPGTHADGVRMRDLAHERDALEEQLAALYPSWERAAAALEAAEAE